MRKRLLMALLVFLTVLVTTFSLGVTRTASVRDPVIAEVAWMRMAAPSGDEWVELYNNTVSDVDLSDWTLSAVDGTPSITLAGTIPASRSFLLEQADNTSVPDVTADLIYRGIYDNGKYFERLD